MTNEPTTPERPPRDSMPSTTKPPDLADAAIEGRSSSTRCVRGHHPQQPMAARSQLGGPIDCPETRVLKRADRDSRAHPRSAERGAQAADNANSITHPVGQRTCSTSALPCARNAVIRGSAIRPPCGVRRSVGDPGDGPPGVVASDGPGPAVSPVDAGDLEVVPVIHEDVAGLEFVGVNCRHGAGSLRRLGDGCGRHHHGLHSPRGSVGTIVPARGRAGGDPDGRGRVSPWRRSPTWARPVS